MDGIISKVYIVSNNNSRFNKIRAVFDKYQRPVEEGEDKEDKKEIDIVKYNRVDKDRLSDDYIKSVATPSCRYMCSRNMVSNWLTHHSLWKDIVKNKETNVLVVEDNVHLVKNFADSLQEYWKEVPAGWDMIYLGCMGSCDESSIKDTYYKLNSRENIPVTKDGKKMFFVMEPGYPLGLYSYLLSYNGAKKLIENPDINKVDFRLDEFIAKDMIDSGNFKAYFMKPALIVPKTLPGVEKKNNHKIVKPFTKNMKISPKQSVNDLSDTTMIRLRHLGITVTYTMIALLVSGFIIGYSGSEEVKRVFLVVVTFMQLSEMAFTKSDRDKLKMLIFELLAVYMSVVVGKMVKAKLNK